ncbi:ATP-grasp fold amidoligase family protein [Cellulomonas sp. S1-8]|uniref:ATP-grasp fold amidoligase family protein n=1 Tax=Cellulomonas sp. S1-8 TaxID=2904790 RepID=UPI002242E2FF|nr:ATP-grasp fold amidoligase family protein [Cellulomonas sp. S1-8]UZN04138.1 ATP-grasp fold amidoligase family protein [Cellulomonas sp. S1-8]
MGLKGRALASGKEFYRSRIEPALRVLSLPTRQRIVFFFHQGRLLRLAKPRTYSDLVLRRLVYDRSPELIWTCDKLAQKDHVSSMATTTRVIPTLWSGASVDELLAADLPEHWVLKRNDSSGWVYFGSGRLPVSSVEDIRRGAAANTTPFERNGEWAYSQARPLLLVEPHIGELGASLVDYKVFVFSGRAVMIQGHSGRSGDHRMSHFDRTWQPMPVRTSRPRCDDLPAPTRLAEMLSDAETIAAGFDFLRVDFYEVDGVLYFGETTAYPAGGLRRFRPYAFELWLGRRWMEGVHYRPDLHRSATPTP